MLLSDRMIRDLSAFTLPADHPASLGEGPPPGAISAGLTSYGYDVRLGVNFLRLRKVGLSPDLKRLDPKAAKEHFYPTAGERHKPFWLEPHEFLLAETEEWVEVPRDCLGVVTGKSTLARVGVLLNCTPLKPAWRGKITLQVKNLTDRAVALYPGEGVAQVLLMRGAAPCDVSYADKKGKYQDQAGATVAKPEVARPARSPAPGS